MWKLFGGFFLGWSLGSNDSANIFGPSVAAGIIPYRIAVILTSIFVIVGAIAEGPKVMDTVGKMTHLVPLTAFITAFSAAITVGAMSYLSLPVSTSQAIIGAVLGVGLFYGQADFGKLGKVILCWVLTPVGALVISAISYLILEKIFNKIFISIKTQQNFFYISLLIAGCYGSYSLGSNNVANVTGVYVGSGMLTPFMASLIGGLSIAFGVITYSKKVIDTVGKKIIVLSPYTAFVAQLSTAVTVHIFTQVGVPVSSSQAVVGAVVGVGLIKSAKMVSRKTLIEIGIGWIATPILPGIIAYFITFLLL